MIATAYRLHPVRGEGIIPPVHDCEGQPLFSRIADTGSKEM